MDNTNYSVHSSVYVAPLRIEKVKRSTSNASRKSRSQSRTHSRSLSQSGHSQSSSHQQFTPPPTPKTSQEALNERNEQDAHTTIPFLRAFYPFHPTYAPGSSTVTLPLNVGDLILVHSIHTNGWADGTMLSSGARGWLPTNYCENYETDQIKLVLKACVNLFDQFRGGTTGGVRHSQMAITGIVAGVRYLLESTECLTRDSANVQASDSVRKSRKVLLTELSGLVKAAKKLPGHAEYNEEECVVEDVTDEMILRTFKIVLRAVRFLDFWYDQYEGSGSVEESMNEEDQDDQVPPTPPADSCAYSVSSSSTSVACSQTDSITDSYFRSRDSARDNHRPIPVTDLARTKQESHPLPSTPHTHSPPRGLSPDIPHYYSTRHSTDSIALQSNFALSRLNSSHDALLSFLGSYIGRIHLQARFTPQLKNSQDHSVKAARELLAVVEAVYARDNRSQALATAKNAMYDRIASLIAASEEAESNRIEDLDDEEEEGFMIPNNGDRLVEAATGCVRGAGECVAKSKFVIERIGDFELPTIPTVQHLDIGLGITTDVPTQPTIEEPAVMSHVPTQEEMDREMMPPPPTPDKIAPPPPPKEDSPVIVQTVEIPVTLTIDTNVSTSLDSPLPPLPAEADEESKRTSSRPTSTASLLPPLLNVSPLVVHDETKPLFNKSVRADSIGADSSAATDSTGVNSIRTSEFSLVSQTSTRATTPEPSSSTVGTPILCHDLSMASQLSLASAMASEPDPSDNSHADELSYNKDGQITGGTLPALVEKLTVHDSTPDAVFVSTFYLTFRLFTTPTAFAEALVDRFDAVATNASGAMPVRLRVYNVFKGWLESHWRSNCDNEALHVVTNFANTRLGDVLPAASKRLIELAEKVSAQDGPLVPRLVSSMGKTTTATTVYANMDTPIAAPIVTRGQLAALKIALTPGAPSPSIVDFDPLEVARQLTLKESRMFCSICPEELIATEWTKKKDSLATNVLAMSSLSTDLAHFVAETILDVQDPRNRARVLKQWIKVADRCLELNNYDTLMAIMCTMNTSTIVRLKKTWELVSQKTKSVLEHLRSVIDVSKNHAVLRARLKSHVPPCLPFLGTYLTDLTFIDVGNPSKRPVSIDGSTKQLINFDKHVKTAKVIAELQRFQIPYRITEVSEMQTWIDAQLERIHNSKAADVQHLYRRSLLLEPRETHIQKMMSEQASPVPPPPALQKENSGKGSDLFAWAHVFKTTTNSNN
ncbi:ras guanine nucleotide exchange factor domain-containing protein [Geopyxis carbonaria]|nr:ras guanine nucleotide exchange factor domain-containing protein [Geopyxis carbonaria]